MKRVLVAGIGNIFLGDDGFGVEVAARLRRRDVPTDVDVVDFGIRGIDLAYALMEPRALAILVDAVPRGEPPGTLYVIEPELPEAGDESTPLPPLIAAHGLDPLAVLQYVRSLGGGCPRVLVVGCEPESFGTEDGGEGRMELSIPVAAAVDRAIETILRLLRDEAAALGARSAGTRLPTTIAQAQGLAAATGPLPG